MAFFSGLWRKWLLFWGYRIICQHCEAYGPVKIVVVPDRPYGYYCFYGICTACERYVPGYGNSKPRW